MPQDMDSMIGDLIGTLADPIIVCPGGWGDSFPEWLKNAIIMERLAENMKAIKGNHPTGTDAEACAYLSTASLTAPMDDDWSQIYLYIAGKTYSRWQNNRMPDDIRVELLNDKQMASLNRLKEWLYSQRTKARQEMKRHERQQKKAEEISSKKSERPELFEF